MKTVIGENKWSDPIDIIDYSFICLFIKDSNENYENSLFLPIFNTLLSGSNPLPIYGEDNAKIGMLNMYSKKMSLYVFLGKTIEIYV